jgi:hypothetical protein
MLKLLLRLMLVVELLRRELQGQLLRLVLLMVPD